MIPNEPIIRVEGLCKRYSTDLQRSLRRGVAEIFREATGRRSERHGPMADGEFMALDHVDLVVEGGSAFGVMGVNGAGKSTLLRILAGLTMPDAGQVTVRGRVGVLLDPMGGFDPLLSGRENIRASCLLWHLSERELGAVTDRVVEFAELGEFIDAPVRTYSKGMRMRLAFAVSVHQRPDVLLVDEALAVGDVRFQQRCEALIHEYLAEGGTLVLVSHSVNAVQGMCDRAVLLDRGRVVAAGASTDIVRRYTELIAQAERAGRAESELADLDAVADRIDHGQPSGSSAGEEGATDPFHGRMMSFSEVTIRGKGGAPVVPRGRVEVTAHYVSKEALPSADWGIQLVTPDGLSPIAADVTEGDEAVAIVRGRGTLRAEFVRFPLMAGPYMLRVAVVDRSTRASVGLHGFDTPATYFVVEGDPGVTAMVDEVTTTPLADLGEVAWSIVDGTPERALRSSGATPPGPPASPGGTALA